ncbi:MAG TPA: hypothetical protein VII87_07120 [Solirubrobacteraceae bacterium]|jgi:hypothetical protein
MSTFPPVPTPLEIDDVQSARVAAGELRLVVSGRWLDDEGPSAAQEPLLVIQVEGHRHRFTPEAGTDTGSPAGAWRASFVIPAWAEPRRAGQAAVWVGDAIIPLPSLHSGRGARGGWSAPPALGAAVAADTRESEPDAEPPVAVAPDPPERVAPAPPATEPLPPLEGGLALADSLSEAPRSGPLAALLLKETVAALHAELEQRGTEAAQLRSALSGAYSELEARSSTQAELEGTLGQLGAELRRLMEAVEEQRRELDQRRTEAERDRADFERRLAEMAAERDRQSSELSAAREQFAAAEAAFQRRVADTAGLREELASVTVSREAARSEAAGLRIELERLGTELAVTRERVQSESGDLGQANRLLADARALADELRGRPEGSY